MRESLVVLNDARDSTRSQDAWGVNEFGEKEGEELTAVKRPGTETAIPGIGTVIGQGLFNFNNQVYAVENDTLWTGVTVIPAWSSTTSYGAGNAVVYQGQGYTAVTPVIGVPPSTGWTLVGGGQTWTQLAVTIPFVTSGGISKVYSVSVGPGGYVYAFDQFTNAAVYKSLDFITWTPTGSFSYPNLVYSLLANSSSVRVWDLVPFPATTAVSSDGVSWGAFVSTSGLSNFPVVLVGSVYYEIFTGTTKTSADGITFSSFSNNLPAGPSGWTIVTMGGAFYALPDVGPFATINTFPVHKSTDAFTWTSVGVPWGISRTAYGCIAFNSKIYVCGGYNGSSSTNTVYSTPDGVTWNIEVFSSVWSPRLTPSLTVFGGALYLLGGNLAVHDVWKMTSSAPTPPASIPL